jgi:hypothetical protein
MAAIFVASGLYLIVLMFRKCRGGRIANAPGTDDAEGL